MAETTSTPDSPTSEDRGSQGSGRSPDSKRTWSKPRVRLVMLTDLGGGPNPLRGNFESRAGSDNMGYDPDVS